MAGKSPGPFPNCDWRFNEFPNPAAHALHVTCVELMALAVPGKEVGNALLNVVLKRSEVILVAGGGCFLLGCVWVSAVRVCSAAVRYKRSAGIFY